MIHRLIRLACATLACATLAFVPATVSCQARDTIDVLYVGNSYVYFNSLPAMVEQISVALDGPIVRGTAHTPGGATLRSHIDGGRVAGLLAEGPAGRSSWDWVILQEQSTLGTSYDRSTGELGGPEPFHSASRELARMIRAAGAQPALYMTWAKEAHPSQAATLARAYDTIGNELGIPVATVGQAWAEVRRRRPDISLHIADGSHPTAAGSYLAACVIYATLTGRSPAGAPREILGTPWTVSGMMESAEPTVLVSLSQQDAEFLQETAWTVAGPRVSAETSARSGETLN